MHHLPRDWSTNPTPIRLLIVDASNAGVGSLTHATSGLVIDYSTNDGSTWTTITKVAGTLGVYTAGGFVASVVTGRYWLGLPPAALPEGGRCLVRWAYNGVSAVAEIRADLAPAALTAARAGYINAGLALMGDAYAADGYVASAVETFSVDPVAFNRLLALANQYGDDGAILARLAATQPQYAPAKAGDAMTLTTGERTSIGTAVWANATRSLTTFGSLVNDIWTHATRILTAGTNIVLAKGTGVTGFNDITPTQAASAVRTELTTELGRIDVATSSRMGTFTYVAPPTAADNASAVRVNLATELARIDVAIGTRATAGDLSGLLTTTAATTRFDTIDAAIAAIQAGSLSPTQADQLAAAAKVGPLIVGDAFTAEALANGVGGGGVTNRTIRNVDKYIR